MSLVNDTPSYPATNAIRGRARTLAIFALTGRREGLPAPDTWLSALSVNASSGIPICLAPTLQAPTIFLSWPSAPPTGRPLGLPLPSANGSRSKLRTAERWLIWVLESEAPHADQRPSQARRRSRIGPTSRDRVTERCAAPCCRKPSGSTLALANPRPSKTISAWPAQVYKTATLG